MSGSTAYRSVFLFASLYISLSFLPFIALNQEILDDVQEQVTVNVVAVGIIGVMFLLVVSALFLADEGVDRYNQFLFAPTDLLSILVSGCFLLAATSWWLVLEVTTWYGAELDFNILLFAVILSQVPMVLFLSLLTVVGKS